MDNKNQEIEQWDGSLYSQNSDFQFSRALKLISLHTFHGTEVILDVGCGDGKISAELARRVPGGKVVGIDFSADMISHAKAAHQVDNLEFFTMNAEHINAESEFDLVTSFFSLHWVPDKKEAIRRIFRSLKPGGQAILIMPHRNEILANARFQVLDLPEWKTVFAEANEFTAPLKDTRYLQYAESEGFEITFYDTHAEQINFPNVQSLTDLVRSITAHLGMISSEADKQKFMHQLMENYFKEVPVLPDGSCSISFDFITMIISR
jgi:trans-aconitate 2-methyltransferase